jgi:hypothetical protein
VGRLEYGLSGRENGEETMGCTGESIRGNRTRGALVLAGLVAFGLGACGGDESVTEPVGGSVVSEQSLADAELGSVLDELTQSLGLSEVQRAAIQELVARSADRANEPGAAWYAAAELQAILSSEQIAALDSRLATARGRVRMEHGERSATRDGSGERSRAGSRSSERMPGGARGYAWLDLTEEQQTQIQAVLESHRTEFQALREELRDSDLSRDEMRSRAEAVHEAIRAEIEPLLTQDQRDRLQEREVGLEERRTAALERREAARQRGEAEHAAMVDALELTDTQIEQMKSLRQDRGAHREAFGEILTDEQQEIVVLHRALAGDRFRAAGSEGRGARGERRGGGEGRFDGARGIGGPRT